jgi:hypothetical protein
MTWRANQSFRYSVDDDQLNSYHVWAGAQFHKRSWVEHAYYLRYALNREGEDNLDEWRPTFDLTFKWNWGAVRWANRSRFEYRVRENKDDVFRYRNRQKVTFPGHYTPLNMKPYGAVELLVDENADSDNHQFRGLLGLQTEADGFVRKHLLQHGRRLKGDAYVMVRRTERPDGSFNDYVLGLKMGYYF